MSLHSKFVALCALWDRLWQDIRKRGNILDKDFDPVMVGISSEAEMKIEKVHGEHIYIKMVTAKDGRHLHDHQRIAWGRGNHSGDDVALAMA
jgi:hypothetical protein